MEATFTGSVKMCDVDIALHFPPSQSGPSRNRDLPPQGDGGRRNKSMVRVFGSA
ncbi:unnamed protein product [Spirodela intermedia]|uniref:Uncharacterized protein n=1 Tax=Spirodela intermedia TaxID=51605 RepID=A0A7I8KKL9_SPIIN|nr:unnamed protein product [Spirodela intermedia]